MFAAQRLRLWAVLFYAAKPKGRRSTQSRLNNASNHPNQAHSRPNSLGDRLARAWMGLDATSRQPSYSQV